MNVQSSGNDNVVQFDQSLSDRGLLALRAKAAQRKQYASRPYDLGLMKSAYPLHEVHSVNVTPGMLILSLAAVIAFLFSVFSLGGLPF